MEIRLYLKPFRRWRKEKGKQRQSTTLYEKDTSLVFTEWEEVEQQINVFPGAIYKSFKLKRYADFFMKHSEIQDSAMPYTAFTPKS